MRSFAILTFLAFALTAEAAPSAKEAALKIDTLLQRDWKKSGLQGNPELDDNTFVRRIYLDIIGRIPTTREVETFLASDVIDKRSKLIDQLLASEGYVQHIYNYWADVLRVTSNGNQTGAITGSAYMNFVKESLRKNQPYDQFVRDMVAAQGKAWETGAIGYYMRDRGMPLDNMANTVRVFLGTRIECAQCHNHPFDKWSQMQFYQMAAFTYGIETQDYYGGTVGEVRDYLREMEEAATKAIPEPKRPQRPERPKIKGQVSKEERQKLEKQYADAWQRHLVAEKNYQAEYKAYRAKVEEMRQKVRKEQRSFQEPMNDIRDTIDRKSVV